MRKLFLLVPVLSLVLCSCMFDGKKIRGNGTITKEQRKVSSFHTVEVRGNMDVYLVQGELKPVEIEGDENLLQYVEFEQTGSKLVVKAKTGYNLDPSGELKIYVTAPEFEEIDVSGACNIYSQAKINNDKDIELKVSGAGEIKMEVDAPKIDITLRGAGKVDLKGETKNFKLDLSGASSAHCYELLSEETEVDISGAGSADVYASQKLDGRVSGAGSIRYKGNAKEVKQHVSGAGSISKTD